MKAADFFVALFQNIIAGGKAGNLNFSILLRIVVWFYKLIIFLINLLLNFGKMLLQYVMLGFLFDMRRRYYGICKIWRIHENAEHKFIKIWNITKMLGLFRKKPMKIWRNTDIFHIWNLTTKRPQSPKRLFDTIMRILSGMCFRTLATMAQAPKSRPEVRLKKYTT